MCVYSACIDKYSMQGYATLMTPPDNERRKGPTKSGLFRGCILGLLQAYESAAITSASALVAKYELGYSGATERPMYTSGPLR